MAPHFSQPDRFIAGTVGAPGERAFFVQARQGRQVVTIAVEKQQVALLARRTAELLDEIVGIAESHPGSQVVDNDPLDSPFEVEFRAGTMTLSWDPDARQIVVEIYPFETDVEGSTDVPATTADEGGDGPGDDYPEDAFMIWLSPAQARAFADRATRVIGAGRAPCPFCGGPINATGHLCPRANGFRRRDP